MLFSLFLMIININNESTLADIKRTFMNTSETSFETFFQTFRSSRFYENNLIKQYNQYNNSFNRD